MVIFVEFFHHYNFKVLYRKMYDRNMFNNQLIYNFVSFTQLFFCFSQIERSRVPRWYHVSRLPTTQSTASN